MVVDAVTIASGAVTLLAPFMPHLVKLGETIEEKLYDAVVKEAGESGWNQARNLWAKIQARLSGDSEVSAAATMVAASPSNIPRREMLTEVLAKHVQSDPALAEELLAGIGGPHALQQIVAGSDATISNIRMRMGVAGEQKIQAGDRVTIRDVNQRMG